MEGDRPASVLQWGRNLSVAEGGRPYPPRMAYDRLQWGRNLSVAEGRSAHRPGRRAPGLQWGRNLSVAEGGRRSNDRLERRASMGPQPFGCGRVRRSFLKDQAKRLQWGRNLSVAEGRRRRGGARRPKLLQWGRNLSVAEGSTSTRSGCDHRRFNGAATFRLRKA